MTGEELFKSKVVKCLRMHASCFSCLQMFATLWTISLPWDSPGQNTGVCCHAFL